MSTSFDNCVEVDDEEEITIDHLQLFKEWINIYAPEEFKDVDPFADALLFPESLPLN